MKGVRSYKNGNYKVWIFADGTKIRRTEEDEFIPEFSENVDVKLTAKCGQGCQFCYEGCTKEGKHGELFKYENFINSLHPYTEMALNGNDLDHPDLRRFLEFLKEKKVFANITVHQNQYMKGFEMLKEFQEEGLIQGIGVSLSSPTPEFIEKLLELKHTVLHTINGILKKSDLDALKNKGVKLLILGYKNLQRGIKYKENNLEAIEANQKYLRDNLDEIFTWFKVCSFDNLALEQLDVRSHLSEKDWKSFYMGDDGGFTFYIDLVDGQFARNSLSQERYAIGDKTIDEMFKIIRDHETDNQTRSMGD